MLVRMRRLIGILAPKYIRFCAEKNPRNRMRKNKLCKFARYKSFSCQTTSSLEEIRNKREEYKS